MIKLTIYLKGGAVLEVICEDYEFGINRVTGEFTGYRFDGFTKRVTISPSQIIAYQADKVEELEEEK